MTPPAPAVPSTALPPPTALPSPTALASRGPAPRLRAVPPLVTAAWHCDNCDLPNTAHRRRCTDCGTSRF